MNPDDERELLLAYPLIFRRLESRLPSGERFECGAGWKAILADLAAGLEQIVSEDGRPVAVEQVKQKFGSLRVYLAQPPTEAETLLLYEAHKRSLRTCELCGAPGLPRGMRHRMRVLCEPCTLPSRKEPSSQ